MKLNHFTVRDLSCFLFILISSFFYYPLYAEQSTNKEVISPILLDSNLISGVGLEEVPWFDNSVTAKWNFLFTGKELSVSVFESALKEGSARKSSNNRVTDYPWDQFVVVLSGKSVLTDANGNAQSFVAGDYFVVPKGFNGTWESFGVYRELIVILEEAVRTREIKAQPVE